MLHVSVNVFRIFFTPSAPTVLNLILLFMYIYSLLLIFYSLSIFCGECGARPACTYVQAGLAPHSSYLYHHFFLSKKPNPGLFNKGKSVCEIVNSFNFGQSGLTLFRLATAGKIHCYGRPLLYA